MFVNEFVAFQGTPMVFRLITEDQRDRLYWLFHEGRQFHLCDSVVEDDGLGIHDEYHLVAHHKATSWPTTEGVFPPFLYNVKSCVQIAIGATSVDGLFGNDSSTRHSLLKCLSVFIYQGFMCHVDNVGFGRIANPTTFMKSNCAWDAEMCILLVLFLCKCSLQMFLS